MKLIVGLGNPGKEYEGTRHNIGREVVCALSDDWKLDWKLQKKLLVEIAKGDDAILALPMTYMNDSGRAVQALVTSYKLPVTNLLIVHDDLDLPLGTIRFSKNASSGGHKGVQSIVDALGTKDFVRLRIGVAGAHRETTDAADYVLKKFTTTERKTVARVKEQSIKALKDFINEPLAKVMSVYN